MLSSTTEKLPGWLITLATKSPKPRSQPLAGGNGPLNLPVVGSIVGSAASGFKTVPRPSMETEVEPTFSKLDAGRTGVTGLVTRADSRFAGPDWKELISNAVTE